MATVTDINIHAIPVYDGQSASGLNPAQQGSNRSENFGQALSESSSQYHKNNKEQWVKKEAADSSTVEPAPATVTETSADAASNRGEAQQRAINRQAEAASVATESSRVHDERARQDLPVEGNALPKQAVTGMLNAIFVPMIVIVVLSVELARRNYDNMVEDDEDDVKSKNSNSD